MYMLVKRTFSNQVYCHKHDLFLMDIVEKKSDNKNVIIDENGKEIFGFGRVYKLSPTNPYDLDDNVITFYNSEYMTTTFLDKEDYFIGSLEEVREEQDKLLC